MNAYLLLIALIVFLLCMFLVDTLQVLFRAISVVMSTHVLGAHLGSTFMLINRACAALALLTIGYLVDTSTPSYTLLSIYAIASLLIASAHLPLLLRAPMLNLTLIAFKRFYGKTFPQEVIQDTRRIQMERLNYRILPSVVIVTAVGFVGLLGPSLIASAISEYRATLMQTGFILNSVASIINVIHVERKMAMIMDAGDHRQINSLYNSYTVSRSVGYASVAAIFALILLIERFFKSLSSVLSIN